MKPYLKTQMIKLVGLQDRRRVLTDENREDIIARYQNGEKIREIARVYEGVCSRRSIQYVLFPERLKIVQENARKKQAWKIYFNRSKLTEAMRNLRNYKYSLFKNNL